MGTDLAVPTKSWSLGKAPSSLPHSKPFFHQPAARFSRQTKILYPASRGTGWKWKGASWVVFPTFPGHTAPGRLRELSPFPTPSRGMRRGLRRPYPAEQTSELPLGALRHQGKV